MSFPRFAFTFWLLTTAFISGQEAAVHFKPRDHALGDVHPFFQNGECFLYYLKPGKYESALVTMSATLAAP